MKRFAWFSALSVLLLSQAGAASATSFTIGDNYIGGTETSDIWRHTDSINTGGNFDVDHMVVNIGNGMLTVSVYADYFTNVGASGTENGALFISTNGYKPAGKAPYLFGNLANGEGWEYALRMDNSQGGLNTGDTSGVAFLYQINDPSRIQTSDNFFAGTDQIYRAGQAVDFNANGLNSLAFGSWSIVDVANSSTDVLTFSISLSSLGISELADLGFHWTQTCANDVIEGGVSTVPEPSTLVLLGLGAAGAIRRKHKKA